MINNDSIVEMYEPEQTSSLRNQATYDDGRPKPLRKGDGRKKKQAERQPLQMNKF